MPPKHVRPPDVTRHRFHSAMAAHLHHAQRIGAGLGRAGEEPGPQTVAGKLVGFDSTDASRSHMRPMPTLSAEPSCSA